MVNDTPNKGVSEWVACVSARGGCGWGDT